MLASYQGTRKGKNPSDVWEFPNVKNNHPEKTIHPCQFPVELVERLVLSMTNEEDAVFDPFMGVGSSVVAALMHGRQAYGCDIVEEYVDIARRRVDQLYAGTLRSRPMGKPIYNPAKAKWRTVVQIKARHSHLNGEEYLLVHRKQLWEEVQAVIEQVLACWETSSVRRADARLYAIDRVPGPQE